jgi:hypothetical protein
MRTSWQRLQANAQGAVNADRGGTADFKEQARATFHTKTSLPPPLPSPVTFACAHHMTFLNLIPFRDRTCPRERLGNLRGGPKTETRTFLTESFVLHHTYLET